MPSRTPAAVRPSTASSGRSGPAAFNSRRRPNRGFCRPAQPWHDPASPNERALYGDLLEVVRFLRRRGFGVHREADRGGRRQFRVGNRLVSSTGLKSIAARERRLLSGS